MPATLDLARVLKRKRVSRRAFAKRLKMDIGTLYRYLRPGANPTLDMLNRFADALKVRVRDLIRE